MQLGGHAVNHGPDIRDHCTVQLIAFLAVATAFEQERGGFNVPATGHGLIQLIHVEGRSWLAMAAFGFHGGFRVACARHCLPRKTKGRDCSRPNTGTWHAYKRTLSARPIASVLQVLLLVEIAKFRLDSG